MKSGAPKYASVVRFTRLTPPGEGGVGKLLVWGAGAPALLARLFRGRRPLDRPGLYHGVLQHGGELLDEVLLELAPPPPERVALSTHGGEQPLLLIERALAAEGAVRAGYDGYLQAALAAGRLDRGQAEARLALPAARTALAVEVALAGIAGRFSGALREIATGATAGPAVQALQRAAALGRALFCPGRLVLVGPTGAGKSSLFNRLAGARALVADSPHTTRDYLTAPIALCGVPFELVDTPATGAAGLVGPQDGLLLLLAGDAAEAPRWLHGRGDVLPLWHKADRWPLDGPRRAALQAEWGAQPLELSSTSGAGLETLGRRLLAPLLHELSAGPRRAIPLAPAQWALVAALERDVASGAGRSILARRIEEYFSGWER